MRWLHQLQMRILMLFNRAGAGGHLEDELSFHLERQIAGERRRRHDPRRSALLRPAHLWQSSTPSRTDAINLVMVVLRIHNSRYAHRMPHTVPRPWLRTHRHLRDGTWPWRKCRSLHRRPWRASQAATLCAIPTASSCSTRASTAPPLEHNMRPSIRQLLRLAEVRDRRRADGDGLTVPELQRFCRRRQTP